MHLILLMAHLFPDPFRRLRYGLIINSIGSVGGVLLKIKLIVFSDLHITCATHLLLFSYY